MQLLMTEREFCDFVLYAENAPVSVQRIERDEHIILEILKLLKAFWKRVIAPELIEMRVPRNLMPFVLPDMKNAPDSIKVTTTSDTENMKNAPDNIKVTTTSDNGNMTNAPDSINVTTTLNTGNEYDCSHTKDEMAVADCLVNALRTSVSACPSLYSEDENQSMVNSLIVIPWGGITSDGLTLYNTCPLDNWIMIFQALVKSKKVDLSLFSEIGDKIKNVLNMIDNHQYGDAKVAVLLTKPTVTANIINFYGNESDFFLKLLTPYLHSTVTTTSNLNTCPKSTQLLYSSVIPSLEKPSYTDEEQLDSVLNRAIADWVNPGMSYCKRKFVSKPPATVPHFEDIAVNIECEQTVR